MGERPPTPKEVCTCLNPIRHTGLNLRYCWGETVCAFCHKHIKWGVAP